MMGSLRSIKATPCVSASRDYSAPIPHHRPRSGVPRMCAHVHAGQRSSVYGDGKGQVRWPRGDASAFLYQPVLCLLPFLPTASTLLEPPEILGRCHTGSAEWFLAGGLIQWRGPLPHEGQGRPIILSCHCQPGRPSPPSQPRPRMFSPPKAGTNVSGKSFPSLLALSP